jgi:UDP-xylose/UDP-N-acetylglucosamine transporter B4
MVLLAVLGYVQGQAYEKYGKHPEEMVFYTHLLPLPMFMLFGNESSTKILLKLRIYN